MLVRKFASPAYTAVNVWTPSANVDTVMLASPVDEIVAIPNEVAPSWKLTVPVAIRPLIVYGVTLAVSVTGVPKAIVPAVESSSEVDVVTGNPLPLNATCCVLPDTFSASLVMVTLPVRAPVCCGWKSKARLQFAPVAKLARPEHVPDESTRKSVVAVRPLILRSLLPMFEIVTACVALVCAYDRIGKGSRSSSGTHLPNTIVGEICDVHISEGIQGNGRRLIQLGKRSGTAIATKSSGTRNAGNSPDSSG